VAMDGDTDEESEARNCNRALKRGLARNTKKMWRNNSGMGSGQATYEREGVGSAQQHKVCICSQTPQKMKMMTLQ